MDTVCAIKGNFDDAQNGVKKIFSDSDIAEKLNAKGYFLSSANSINWGRLAPQIVYYFSAYCDLVASGEINAGDDIELMFGVSVTDELDEEPKLIIQDDDGFDAEVEGTYVITYLAQNKFGNTATATRTIKVNKALSALTLEVQKNLLGENKWQGTLLNFKNKEFVTLTSSATLDKQSGVFYNASSSSITVTVSGIVISSIPGHPKNRLSAICVIPFSNSIFFKLTQS